MTSKTLTRDCRCAICGASMKAGDSFRWHTKSGYRAANQGGGIYERHRPVHADANVCHQIMTAPSAVEIAQQAEIAARFNQIEAGMLAGTMTAEQALALLNS